MYTLHNFTCVHYIQKIYIPYLNIRKFFKVIYEIYSYEEVHTTDDMFYMKN